MILQRAQVPADTSFDAVGARPNHWRRYSRGYLVVALQTAGAKDLTYDDIDQRARRVCTRSLFTLAKEEVRINVEDGWLKALWEPAGFVIFPGFSADKWRSVLNAMHTLASSLEAA